MFSHTINTIVAILCTTGILLTGCASSEQRKANDTVDFMYKSASNGDTQSILNAIARDHSVNETDSDGQTALCKAVEDKNYKAYGVLLVMGAKPNPICIQEMDKDDYKEFIAGQPRDIIYTRGGQEMIRYVPDHNPPQQQYDKPMNNSVITATVLVISGVALTIFIISLF